MKWAIREAVKQRPFSNDIGSLYKKILELREYPYSFNY